MQQRLWGHHALARGFAVGIALAGLMLAFLAATLLVFPYKATANPEVQGELLYDLLGHLEYDGKGHFGAIDDPVMQQKLAALISGNRLGGVDSTAYIIKLADGGIAWAASATPRRFDGSEVANTYAMQFIPVGDHQLAVQNFWLTGNDERHIEFRMVVALSAN